MRSEITAEFRTDLHPCSVEALKSIDSYSLSTASRNREINFFLCSSYELDDKTDLRNGEIVLFKLEENSIVPIERVKLNSGVLDVKIHNHLVILATSCGSLDILRLNYSKITKYESFSTSEEEASLFHTVRSISKEDEGLFLSVDINRCTGSEDSNENLHIYISTQNGSILLYSFKDGNIIEILHLKRAHVMFGECMPVWIAVLDPFFNSILITGGDDCLMKVKNIYTIVIRIFITKL